MSDYPNKLDNIFVKLDKYNIKPIIVGGYVRDKLLNIVSKDIDIELYGVQSFEEIEKILQEFGSVNSVGRSFGVCKLKYKNLDLDFSLPRKDSKVFAGHKGFEIETLQNINFKTAASRRDFTMNAIGYDVRAKKLLDPYKGVQDIKAKVIRAVDLEKFADDPLRVLRAIGFSARFSFSLDKKLFFACKNMIEEGLLEELAKERIFDELQKLLIKSPKPSIGFKLLKEIHGFLYFKELSSLSDREYEHILDSLDSANANIRVMLALLCSYFSKENTITFLQRVTNKKRLIEDILSLLNAKESINIDNFTDYEVYKLATKVKIELFTDFIHAFYSKDKEINRLIKDAKRLNVFTHKMEALVQGRDIIELGIKPSPKFSKILQEAYEAQMKTYFTNRVEALQWLKKNIKLNSF